MPPWIKQLAVGPMANFAYLVGDPAARQCAVVDPGWEADRIVAAARDAGQTIAAVWLTHTHFDHIGALKPLLRTAPVPVYVHELEAGQCTALATPVHPVRDGDQLTIGEVSVRCWHTPGHTVGGQCFVGAGFVLTGDTLFVDAIGRTDLPGADPEQMFASLKRLATLPPGTVIYSGHHYGREPTSTIAEQLQRNPYLRCHTAGEFLRL